jgi:hypothetical protein
MATFRRIRINLAFVFGAFAAVKLFHRDLDTGLWSFAVCLALVLGLLPPWLTGSNPASKKVEPEEYHLLPK